MVPPQKRKWDEVDEDDEEPSLGRQVLPVANLPHDFDGVPEDGLQYLFTVRYGSIYRNSSKVISNIYFRRDAKLLPRVTRVPNPYEIDEKPQISLTVDEASPSAHAYMPSQEWQDLFLRRFRNFRQVNPNRFVHSQSLIQL